MIPKKNMPIIKLFWGILFCLITSLILPALLFSRDLPGGEFPEGIARSMEALSATGARYLIITPDTYADEIQPLAEWKHKKGMQCRIVTLSEVGGSDTASIHNYIRNAYNNWEVRPEFLLLVGNGPALPYKYGCCTSYGGYYGDWYYANIDADIEAEIYVGRFSSETSGDVTIQVNKTLGYERTPLMSETNWYLKGTVIVRYDGDWDDTIYVNDINFAASQMRSYGYTHIDTFNSSDDDRADVEAAVQNGRTFVLFRGQGTSNWWNPFNVIYDNTNNGYKLPIVISPTCHMINSGSYEEAGEYWMRACDGTTPEGSVGFLGTTSTMSNAAHLRSRIARGFFQGAFADNILHYGAACEAARLRTLYEWGDTADYESFITLGDPELNMWTAVPRTMVVTHAAEVPIGPSSFNINVTVGGSPVNNALVCVLMDTVVYEYGYTNASGNLNLSINPAAPGTLWVTVTARNCHPYEGFAQTILAGVFLTYESHILYDSDFGNGDGLVNPGETIEITLGLRNIGTSTAEGVQAKLRCSDPYVTLIDSNSTFPNIPPDASRNSNSRYSFLLSPDCPGGHLLPFTVHARNGSDETWNSSQPNILVSTAEFAYLSETIDDSPPAGNNNGNLNPGEFITFTVNLENNGQSRFDNVRATLTTEDSFIVIVDPTAEYGQILAGNSRENTDDPFRFSVYGGTPAGYGVTLILELLGECGTYSVDDTFEIILTIANLGTGLPTGPDSYGYWAFDNTDTAFSEAPVYNWMEIGSGGSGTTIAAITNADDQITNISIPFWFKYYGVWYNTISVCSNGFAALGSESWSGGGAAGHERPIPNVGEASKILAGYWDDLNPSAEGDIYQYHDETNHRFIIEYDGVCHYGYPSYLESFQIILYDPSHHPTPTGDGLIVFQYQDLDATNDCTVGIEDHTEADGIEYVYRGDYDVHAAVLTNGRAIKFTTSPPSGGEAPWLFYLDKDINDNSGGNNNGFAEVGEDIQLTVHLENLGEAAASLTTGTLRVNSSMVTIIDSTANFGNIPADAINSNSDNPFIIHVNNIPADTFIVLNLYITANLGSYHTLVYFDLPLYIAVGIGEGEIKLPESYCLDQNYPNPFNSQTSFSYAIPVSSKVTITIYNLLGETIEETIIKEQPAGRYGYQWNAAELPTGIYYYRLSARNFSETRRMLLMK
ncbi:T9SS type A sorting domain-containing protein [bacterium]|nr:T9SS type A sorting domain-containing protein [bacterium]